MNPSHSVFIADYDYDLPQRAIAEHPLPRRDASRLLIYRAGMVSDQHFYELPAALPPIASLVTNNTRVIEARIHFQKETGGRIEVFCLSPKAPAEMAQSLAATGSVEWYCLIGGASKWKPGQVLHKKLAIEGSETELTARFVGKSGEQFIIDFTWDTDLPFAAILQVAGAIPLPPYIKRQAEAGDAERYQTVFAQSKGSVAAPTAALHFTPEVFAQLTEKGITTTAITLHVGAGTFKPVKAETIADHTMHTEPFSVTVPALQELLAAECLVAVGTTSLRTLESLHWMGVKLLTGEPEWQLGQWEAYSLDQTFTYRQSLQALLDYLVRAGTDELICETSLLIMPGYRFRSAQGLITNFHQPRSTLLLLVAAFIGEDWKNVYAHALEKGYRFLSYGDSSLLWRTITE